MIAEATQSFGIDNLPFGWFDIVLVLVALFGAYCGRKNGMTKEIMPTLRWVAIVIAAGLSYEFAGPIFNNFFGMSRAVYDCLGYLAVGFVVFLVFVPMENFLVPRLTGSNLFGGAEYYLGVFAGTTRYLAMTLFILALMNAPRYTAADIQAHKAFAAQTFGGGQQGFSGDFFPTFQQVQEGVFKTSITGPFITDHLAAVLINSDPNADGKPATKTFVKH